MWAFFFHGNKRTHVKSGPPVFYYEQRIERINSFQNLTKIEGSGKPREFGLAFNFLSLSELLCGISQII